MVDVARFVTRRETILPIHADSPKRVAMATKARIRRGGLVCRFTYRFKSSNANSMRDSYSLHNSLQMGTASPSVRGQLSWRTVQFAARESIFFQMQLQNNLLPLEKLPRWHS